jgi:Lrp/AsnC family transcriptional regulator for asnA, asnC and gidA
MPDKLDIKIIKSLNQNARKSFREIAREHQVSLTTVSNRVKNLKTEGIIKGFIPLVDLERLKFDLQVVVGVRISHGKLMDVKKKGSVKILMCMVYMMLLVIGIL